MLWTGLFIPDHRFCQFGEQLLDIDCGDSALLDEADRGVARRGEPVVQGAAALPHEGDHLVRTARFLDRLDLAASLRLEWMDPVVLGDVGTRFRVARPDDEVQLTLARANGVDDLRARRRRRLARAPGRRGRSPIARRIRGARSTRCGDNRRGGHQGRQLPVVHAPPPMTPRHSLTRRACCRFQTSRTGRPFAASASIDDVDRFCWVTTSSAPGIESNDVARVRSEVDDRRGSSRRPRSRRCRRARPGRGQADLLRPDRVRPGRARGSPRRPRPLSRLDVPTKPATNARRRPFVDVGRRADLLDPAAIEDREAVAHRERLLLVVGHVDERDPDLLLDRLELDLHLLAELQVEGAERFVEEQDPRPVDERPGEGDALALAAGQLAGLARRRSPRGGPSRAPRRRAARAPAFGTFRTTRP